MKTALPLIYLLAGNPFLRDEKGKQIVQSIQKKRSGESSLKSFRLSEHDLKTVLSEARSLPFLIETQIFRLKDAEELKKAEIETLKAYFEAPADFSFFILEVDEFDPKSALSALASDQGEIHVLESKGKTEGVQFIKDKLKRFNKTIAPDALARLDNETGENASFLDSLIDQLINYSGEQKEITLQMVEAFEENWNETDVFKLTDAIAQKRTGDALYLLRKILDEGEQEIIELIGLLHWQIRRLWQVLILTQDRAPESLLIKKCRMSPKQLPFVLKQAKNLGRGQLERAIEGLFYADWKLKTGQAEGPGVLEDWIVKITAGAGAPAKV